MLKLRNLFYDMNMESKNDLIRRIQVLEDLVEKQKTFINQLLEEKKLNNFQPFNINYDECPMGGRHDYPQPWHSVTPPFCKKCGKQAPDFKPVWTTSYDTNTNISIT